MDSDAASILGASISAIAGLFALSFIGAFAVFVLPMLLAPLASVRIAVVQLAAATVCVYLAANAVKLLSKRRSGYHDDANPVYGSGLGQPPLAGISFAVAVIVVGYSGWWNHRLDAQDYAHAKLCYAALVTADRTPGLSANFVPGYLRRHAAGYMTVAEQRGARLGIGTAEVERDLRGSPTVELRSYSALADATAECVGED